MGFFEKLKQGLSKTASSISSVFTASELDDEFYDDLEESLIVSDLGMDTTEAVMDRLRQTAKEQHIKTVDEAKLALRGILADMLNVGDPALKLDTKPSVILVIGVNGVGKTTTIGKLAHQLHDQGKKVLLCAGDTFRAAAADQLEIWSERAHCDIIRQHEGADPASVVFDAIAAARARGSDVIICDTAGRLHNKQNLMNELNKISRILDRELPGASKEVLLVLDGTTGQNGLLQARQFQECAGVTGMVLTKLDGTAKGGVVIAVAQALHIPVKFIGVGEQIVITRPNLFGPLPQELCDIVYPSLAYRLMAHSAEDLCEYAMTQEQMLACSHGDIRHGFVLEFNEHQPDIDIPTLEARVNELIRQDLPIDYYDESHILLGGAQHYCTGPRTHVRSTGRIIGFRLLDHFIYDHFHKTYMLVGCVGDDSEENIRKLETIHG